MPEYELHPRRSHSQETPDVIDLAQDPKQALRWCHYRPRCVIAAMMT
jgi:hypothetical protein